MIAITRFIFEAYRESQLTPEDFSKSRKLLVLNTVGTLLQASDCYLSNEYQPHLLLQTLHPELNIYVSPDYIQNEEEIPLWVSFFSKLKVKSDIRVYFLATYKRGDACREGGAILKSFFNYLNKTEGSPKNITQGIDDSHYLESFVGIDYIDYMHNRDFARLVWPKLIVGFEKIKQYCEKSCYHLKSKNAKNSIKLPFLPWFFRHVPSITTTNGDIKKSSELITPSLAETFGEFLPCPDIGVHLSHEQAGFFGFRIQLRLDECLRILGQLGGQIQPKASHYTAVFKQLCLLSLSTEEKLKLKNWNGKLLAQDNSLQSETEPATRKTHG